MEDHHHHHHHHHNQYGMADLRQFMNGRTTSDGNLFTAISQPSTAELMNNHLEMLISGGHQLNTDHQMPHRSPFLHHPPQLFRSDSSTTATGATSSGNNLSMGAPGTLDMDFQSGGTGLNGDGGTGRWPRQETLTLLEIRSRLDPKFKEANQKGPLWDEVSRIMSEDHGYQRSGKKCREKFENLYKYYKKTKEGKAGRQDGKHYRFFRQLEALYGESSGNNTNTLSISETPHLTGVGATTFPYTSQPPNCDMFHQARTQIIDDSVTPSNSSAFLTSSSNEQCSDLNAAMALKRRGKRSWKAKIKHFIDGQMKNLLEKQEGWMEKIMKSIEHKEQERMIREEEWRKQEAERIDREHKFWAKERAWIEARDAGLMDAFHNLTGIKLRPLISSSPEADQQILSEMADHHHHQLQNQNDDGSETILMATRSEDWPECEVTRLIQLRTSMDSMFVQQNSTSEEEVLWEEIASNMACLGYENRSALMCKNKWESINNYLTKTKDQSSKKRRENSTASLSSNCFYFQNNESICNNNQRGGGEYRESNDLRAAGRLELTTSSLLTQSRPPEYNSASSAMQSSSFRFFMGDQASDNMWENYGLKLRKADNNNT